MLCLLSFFLLASFVFAGPCTEFDREWKRQQLRYNRNYTDPIELEFRKTTLKKNLDLFAAHNAKYYAGLVTYKRGLNKFTDLTISDAEQTILGLEPRQRKKLDQPPKSSSKKVILPDAIDYRNLSAVTPVKDQGECSASWAIAIAGMLEAQYALATKKLVPLSSQQLIDCSTQNNQCRGGFVEDAVIDLSLMGGIASEQSYPSTQEEGQCHFNSSMAVVQIQNYFYAKRNNEADLKRVVATVGPVVVSYEVTESFLHYDSGIYQGELCTKHDNELNHAMLLVGYGTELGTDYWIVKNSWGTEWGEDGYIRLIRNKDNNCQVATTALYASITVI